MVIEIRDGVRVEDAPPITDRLGWRISPTTNGVIRMLGWYLQTNTAAALSSATPVTASIAGYHSHYVIDVSGASGLPFTIRLSGRSVSEVDGTENPADSEDVTVDANGYYQSAKSWVNAVQFSIVESGKSCTIDIYRTSYWDRSNKSYTVKGCKVEWVPSAPTWNIQLTLLKVNDDGSTTTIDSATFANTDTPPRAASGEAGKYMRTDFNTNISGALKEGIVILINSQNNIANFYTEVNYDG